MNINYNRSQLIVVVYLSSEVGDFGFAMPENIATKAGRAALRIVHPLKSEEHQISMQPLKLFKIAL
jgi:hypothetical protein